MADDLDSLLRDVLLRLPFAGRPPDLAALPGPASDEDVRRFENRHGCQLPRGLRALLAVHDGLPIEPAGIAGIGTPTEWSRSFDELWDILDDYPERGWLPLASDGCGNYWVLDLTPSGGHRVYFVDGHEDEPCEERQWPSYLHWLRDEILGSVSPVQSVEYDDPTAPVGVEDWDALK